MRYNWYIIQSPDKTWTDETGNDKTWTQWLRFRK